jgi:Trk K+ transport system NAD-binding subunit
MPDLSKVIRKKNFSKYLQAQARDVRLLFHESRVSIILFAVLILAGTLIFHFFYPLPDGTLLTFSEALYATFSLIFFQSSLEYPSRGPLQILFFAIPIIGLTLVADGVLRFGTALFNKQDRGQKWQVSMASILRDHIIVCGVGKVGYRVILELLRYGRDVVAIEVNEEGRFHEKVRALNVPLIIADARRSEVLVSAGVDHADSIIPATDNELGNLEIALDARGINPGIKVVMRMFDMELAKKVEKGFGIHTAFSTSALTAPIFAAAAMRLRIRHSFYIGDQLMNVCEVTVRGSSPLEGMDIAAVESRFDLSVLFYQSGGVQDLHPDPALQLKENDNLLVLASLESLMEIKKVNGE